MRAPTSDPTPIVTALSSTTARHSWPVSYPCIFSAASRVRRCHTVALSAEATASAAAINSSVEISASVRSPSRALALLSASRSEAVRTCRPG